MMSEKSVALLEAQFAAAGALAGGNSAVAARKVLAVYKKRVRANKRRLSRR
jgi:predicted metallopeptidase